MKLLKQVFDRLCREHGIVDGSADAQAVSQATMSLFSARVVDEAELVGSLEEFIRRRNS